MVLQRLCSSVGGESAEMRVDSYKKGVDSHYLRVILAWIDR